MASPVVVNATGNPDIDGILWGYKWDTTGFTYSFPTATAEYLNNGYADLIGFQAFSQAQQTAMEKVLQNIESFANVTFTPAPQNEIALFRFAMVDQVAYTFDANVAQNIGYHGPGGGGSAEANPPELAFNGQPPLSAPYAQGDSWYNLQNYNTPNVGSFAFAAGMMHETGHSLGLKHGHNAQTGHGYTFPTLPADHNSYEFSVMTYSMYPGASTTGGDNAPNHPTTYMMNDIAALQKLYGANYTFNATATTYTWSPTTGEYRVNGVATILPDNNFVFQTIWDGGGIDTYDFSNYTTAIVADLGPGKWVNLGTQIADLGGPAGEDHFARGNIFNALQDPNNPTEVASLIENAKGGTGNDRLTGNSVANVLTGNNGNDTLDGGAGNDTLNGGAGTDSLIGGGGDDLYQNAAGDTIVEAAGGGIDRVESAGAFSLASYGQVENLTLTGNLNTNGTGNGLNNTLTGNTANNVLNGGAGNDTLHGGSGNDTLDGGADTDRLNGGAGDDTYVNPTGDLITESAGGGIDLVQSAVTFSLAAIAEVERLILTGNNAVNGTGNALNNLMTGNTGNNSLYGNNGNDTLNGGDGNDTLDGGAGTDSLIGGAGNDVYANTNGDTIVEAAGGGTDVVQSATGYSLAAIANVERLILTGSGLANGTGNALNNTIDGNSAINLLRGGEGNDTINGGGGNDTIAGEGGNDSLNGGAGADLFRFASTAAGTDSIAGFSQGEDRFDLSGGAFTSATVSGANTVLHHTGGTIIVQGITGLNLAQWQALSSGGFGAEPVQPELGGGSTNPIASAGWDDSAPYASRSAFDDLFGLHTAFHGDYL